LSVLQNLTVEFVELSDLVCWDFYLVFVPNHNVRTSAVTHTIFGGRIVYEAVP